MQMRVFYFALAPTTQPAASFYCLKTKNTACLLLTRDVAFFREAERAKISAHAHLTLGEVSSAVTRYPVSFFRYCVASPHIEAASFYASQISCARFIRSLSTFLFFACLCNHIRVTLLRMLLVKLRDPTRSSGYRRLPTSWCSVIKAQNLVKRI